MSNNSIILQILCAVVILIVFNDIVLPPSYAAIAASTGLRGGVSRTTHCEYYNKSVCSESRGQGSEQGCNEREECSSSNEPEKRNHCFVLWRADPTGNMTIELKGCFTNSNECFNKSECVEKAPIPKKDMLFCCCEGDMCNQNFTWDPAPTEPPKIPALADQEEEHKTTLILVGTIILISVICGIGFRFYCKNKLTLFNELPTMDALPEAPPCVGLRPIQLLEIKARGRFGAVWKAQFKTEEVAVKIFPIQDKQSWLSEQEIYKLPHMSHQDILQFIGVEKRGENLQAEFWLITAYHERGSLCDYLKANVLSWLQLCQIAESMARGLMHIHEEIPSTKLQGYKPAIAHRDFKSKNVLLKSDMSACIADFGLALIFEPGQPCGDTHGQVGTRRYMAPEVLEGAINFMRDSFLRIDMYACGLVLWELASRCSYGSTIPPEYRLPLEEEVGQHPTLEDMQEAVVQRKVRPTIKEEWRQHTGLSILCDTMEECWDHDAEARLSASCVMERVALQSRFSTAVTYQRIEPPVSSPTTPLVRDSTLNV